jgi:hypothetical protein
MGKKYLLCADRIQQNLLVASANMKALTCGCSLPGSEHRVLVGVETLLDVGELGSID